MMLAFGLCSVPATPSVLYLVVSRASARRTASISSPSLCRPFSSLHRTLSALPFGLSGILFVSGEFEGGTTIPLSSSALSNPETFRSRCINRSSTLERQIRCRARVAQTYVVRV